MIWKFCGWWPVCGECFKEFRCQPTCRNEQQQRCWTMDWPVSIRIEIQSIARLICCHLRDNLLEYFNTCARTSPPAFFWPHALHKLSPTWLLLLQSLEGKVRSISETMMLVQTTTVVTKVLWLLLQRQNYNKMTSQGMVALVTFSKPYMDDQATKHVLGRTDVTLMSVPENSHQHTTWTTPSDDASSRNII